MCDHQQGDFFFRACFTNEIDHVLLVAGIEAHICVNQTVCDLIGAGYSVEVVADAISSRTAANRQVGLDKMSRAGAGITSVETAMFELLREAGTPEFKEIARLVR